MRMKTVILLFGLLVTITGCTPSGPLFPPDEPDQIPPILRGSWKVDIENLARQSTSQMSVRFSTIEADSCVAGNWKQLIVDSSKTVDKDFFPLDDQLAYTYDGNTLVLGRSAVCDAYLFLEGNLKVLTATGPYYELGYAGRKSLGYFSITRGAE